MTWRALRDSSPSATCSWYVRTIRVEAWRQAVNDPAILALTPRGLDLGRRLAEKLGQGEVVVTAAGPGQVLRELFQEGRPLVCIMALGIVVRLLGPLVRDKETDPPVVVVDEAGR